MENQQRLSLLAREIENCQRCDLYKTATHAVPGFGNANSKIVFIGEAPGFNEDQQGLPFVGQAGKYLDLLFSKVGIKREDVFITNVVKHRPPDNRDPIFSEIVACQIWLEKQIEIIKPVVIVTLGRWSLSQFLPEVKISHVHGTAIKLQNRVILPMYHPAAALRNAKIAAQMENDFLKNSDLLKNPNLASSIDSSADKNGQGRLF